MFHAVCWRVRTIEKSVMLFDIAIGRCYIQTSTGVTCKRRYDFERPFISSKRLCWSISFLSSLSFSLRRVFCTPLITILNGRGGGYFCVRAALMTSLSFSFVYKFAFVSMTPARRNEILLLVILTAACIRLIPMTAIPNTTHIAAGIVLQLRLLNLI